MTENCAGQCCLAINNGTGYISRYLQCVESVIMSENDAGQLIMTMTHYDENDSKSYQSEVDDAATHCMTRMPIMSMIRILQREHLECSQSCL